MKLEEVKSLIQYTDTETQTTSAVGTVNEVYDDCSIVAVVKDSKNGAQRSTIVLINNTTGKRTNLVMSLALTKEFKENRVSLSQIMGFPVFFKEDTKSFFAGLPTMGAIAVKDIAVEEYKPMRLSVADLMNASIGSK